MDILTVVHATGSIVLLCMTGDSGVMEDRKTLVDVAAVAMERQSSSFPANVGAALILNFAPILQTFGDRPEGK